MGWRQNRDLTLRIEGVIDFGTTVRGIDPSLWRTRGPFVERVGAEGLPCIVRSA